MIGINRAERNWGWVRPFLRSVIKGMVVEVAVALGRLRAKLEADTVTYILLQIMHLRELKKYNLLYIRFSEIEKENVKNMVDSQSLRERLSWRRKSGRNINTSSCLYILQLLYQEGLK